MLYVISSSPGERRACQSYLCTVAWLSPLPGRGALTPIYALKRARSGSDISTVSTSPLPTRPRRYHHSVVCRIRFHELARAAGAKKTYRKLGYFSSRSSGCSEVERIKFRATLIRDPSQPDCRGHRSGFL